MNIHILAVTPWCAKKTREEYDIISKCWHLGALDFSFASRRKAGRWPDKFSKSEWKKKGTILCSRADIGMRWLWQTIAYFTQSTGWTESTPYPLDIQQPKTKKTKWLKMWTYSSVSHSACKAITPWGATGRSRLVKVFSLNSPAKKHLELLLILCWNEAFLSGNLSEEEVTFSSCPVCGKKSFVLEI